jgi:hypothetical protein
MCDFQGNKIAEVPSFTSSIWSHFSKLENRLDEHILMQLLNREKIETIVLSCCQLLRKVQKLLKSRRNKTPFHALKSAGAKVILGD